MTERDDEKLRRFHAAYEHVPVGHFTSDRNFRILWADSDMAQMLGYQPDELVGLTTAKIIADSESPSETGDIPTQRGGRIAAVNAIRHLRHRHGHLVPARVFSALVPNQDPSRVEWLSIVVDLTKHEQARTDLDRAHRMAVDAVERMRLLHGIARLASSVRPMRDVLSEVLDMTCDYLGEDAAAALVKWADHNAAPLIEHVRRRQVGQTRPDVDIGRSLVHLRPAQLSPGVNRAAAAGPLADRNVILIPLGETGGEFFSLVFRTADQPGEDHADLLALVGIEARRVVERDFNERQLQVSEARFRTVFSRSPLPMAISLNRSGRFDEANDALCALLGRTSGELAQLSARDIVHPDDIVNTDAAGAAALAAPDGRHSVELRLVHSSGAVMTTVTTLQWVHGQDGSETLLAQMEDITARRRAEATLVSQAMKDGLTDLANRSRLHSHLSHVANASVPCAVLFIDLDSFKLINDSRGHDVGDEVLVEVAARLRYAVRPSDLVARFGGDEFVVVATGGPGETMDATAQAIASRIERSFASPVDTVVGQVAVTASIGIASGTVSPSEPDELVARADKAMYSAKVHGRSRCETYNNSMHQEVLARRRAEVSLRNALADNRFVVHYQPLVNLDNLAVSGFEALVRLRDESGALVPPASFLQIAEQVGLMVPLGAWVLTEACREVQALRERHPGRALSIAVNVAAEQVARPDFQDTVLATLEETGLPAHALALELTESALLSAERATLNQLVALRDLGVGVSLDDFGTGYSSMTYLRTFPVTQLKIDRSFVSGVQDEGGDRAIVRAVAGLAHDLGLTCVAEGIETIEHHEWVREIGVDEAQGYLYSRPVPADALDELIDEIPVPGNIELDALSAALPVIRRSALLAARHRPAVAHRPPADRLRARAR